MTLFFIKRYFSSGVVSAGINKCMYEIPAQTNEPKLIRPTIADLTETDLDAISQLQLMRLIAKAIPCDNINSQAQDQLVCHFMKYGDALQYVITLQTRIVSSPDPIKRELQMADATEDARHFWKRVNYKLWGVAAKRFPTKCSLLTLSFLEGGVFAPNGFRTLHFHVGVGNVSNKMDLLEFSKLIRNEWAKTRYGANDIDIKPPSRGVLEYVTKEMKKGNWDCVDPVNTFIPQLAPPA